jgi:hypothetical protein
MKKFSDFRKTHINEEFAPAEEVGVEMEMNPSISTENTPADKTPAVDQNADSYFSHLLAFLPQIKIFHWGTFGFAQHEAAGKIYEAWDETLDDLVEAYQGHYPRIKFSPSLSMVSYGEGTHETWITTTEKCLSDLRSTLPQTDLQNMIDELLGVISKFRFLLTLDK